MDPLLETLRTYVNLPSGSFDKAPAGRLADAIAADLTALGMQVTAHPGQLHGPTLVARWGHGPRQLMLMGHYDTVFPEAISQPFRMVDGAKATGSGITDMKGGIALMVHALRRALPQVDPAAHAVVCVLNADEEVGSGESQAHILANARQSFAALSFEPGRGGGMTVQRKGVTSFEVRTTGIGGHAGSDYKKGHSAIEELVRRLAQLYALRDDSRDISINIGVLSGGTADNVLATTACARGEVRSYDPDEMQLLHQKIRDICAAPPLEGAGTTLVFKGSHPPCRQTPQSLALFETAREIGQSLGRALHLQTSGGASDIAFAAQAGIPVLDGLGAEGGGMHTTEEYIDLTKLDQQLEMATRLVGKLLGERSYSTARHPSTR